MKWAIAGAAAGALAFGVPVLRLMLRAAKYGHSTFEMAAVPGVVGGSLAGIVRVPRRVKADDGFELTLSWLKTEKSGDSSTTRVVWQDDRSIARELRARRS